MTSQRPVSVLHLTDTHILPAPDDTLLGVPTLHYLNRVLDAILSSTRHFDFCLVTGDIAQDPYPESYRLVRDALARLPMPCYCLPGNHDDIDVMKPELSSGNVSCDKRIMSQDWQIIALESQIPGSTAGFLPDTELRFLSDCLESEPNRFALIAVHHHSIPSGSAWMDSMIIGNAPEFLGILDRYPKAAVLINGHIHQVMEMRRNSLNILTTPSTNFQFKPGSESFALDDSSPGYRWLELFPDGEVNSGVVRIMDKIEGLGSQTEGY